MKRSYFFDLHPPFGRLVYVLIAWVFGFDGEFTPDDAGDSLIQHGVPYIALRSFAALLSTLTVSLIYLIMWESGCAVPACLVAAGLVLLDNAQIAQTRLIYLDAILCFSIICSIYCYIKFSKSKDQPMSTQWWKWLLLTGLALSCSISTKYVGVFTFATIGSQVAIDLWALFDLDSGKSVSLPSLTKHVIARGIALLVIPFAIYLLWFQLHFAILNQSGTGDLWMSKEFVETLSSNTTSSVKTVPFLKKWAELQKLMFEYNGLTAGEHPYQSRPHQWPLALRGVLFWCSNANRQQIYFIGNIIGWWIASASIALFLIILLIDRLCKARKVKLLKHGKAFNPQT
jgi:dolichyl-phosphate-mannose--protein O-mannosyl transferase